MDGNGNYHLLLGIAWSYVAEQFSLLLKKKPHISVRLKACREDRIRTCDPLVPNQVRYRPALLPGPQKTGLNRF